MPGLCHTPTSTPIPHPQAPPSAKSEAIKSTTEMTKDLANHRNRIEVVCVSASKPRRCPYFAPQTTFLFRVINRPSMQRNAATRQYR